MLLIRAVVPADDGPLRSHLPTSYLEKKFCIKIDIKKTEVLIRPNSSAGREMSMMSNENINCSEFTCLGSKV